MEQGSQTDLSPVCALGALTREQRMQHQQAREAVQQAIEETRELADGYAFRFLATPATLRAVAEFMGLEHLCCPFFAQALALEPGKGGALWLRITGSEAAKAFMQAELGLVY